MRQVVFTRDDRLVYLDEKATPEFWDARWRAEGRPHLPPGQEIVRVTAKYLPAGCSRP